LNSKIDSIIESLQKEFPEEDTGPEKSNPLDVLIATMLSQNTTDKTSYLAFRNLKKIGSWNRVMNTPLSRIRKAIKVCGLSNQKAKNIKNLLKAVKKKYGKLSLNILNQMQNGEIYEELLRYKGVGTKTVSCVLAFALGRDVFPVDTHIHRLCNRLGLVNSRSPEKTFETMKNIVPMGKKYPLHLMLIRFGRKVCRANNPLCGKCILYELCEFKDREKYAAVKTLPKENNFVILEHV
jgi:endonuclease III